MCREEIAQVAAGRDELPLAVVTCDLVSCVLGLGLQDMRQRQPGEQQVLQEQEHLVDLLFQRDVERRQRYHPELVAVVEVGGDEEDLVGGLDEELRRGRARPRQDVLDEPRAHADAVGFPELESCHAVGRREGRRRT